MDVIAMVHLQTCVVQEHALLVCVFQSMTNLEAIALQTLTVHLSTV